MLRSLHMVRRRFWLQKIEEAWKERSVIWLTGVRRAGKTYLSKGLEEIEYFDCERPHVRQALQDPEAFLESVPQEKRVVLDEIHRLMNPSELLKIAADHYPRIRILATGSSSLGASRKFRDTLTGRKKEIWLTPMALSDLEDFDRFDFKHRFLYGGLPPFFLAKELPESDFQEWMDSYWAKDIQELFRLERRDSFQKFFELMMTRSGGIFEATRYTQDCEVSRTTISNYLKVLEATWVVHVIRPFSSHRPTEIVSAPKVYGFDTGFICYYRGWSQLRLEDNGLLWEHLVLNELHAHLQSRKIRYWRDKRGHEIDFVIPRRGKSKAPVAIECKWKSGSFDTRSLKAFLYVYAQAEAFVVSSDVERPFTRKCAGTTVRFTNLPSLIRSLREEPLAA